MNCIVDYGKMYINLNNALRRLGSAVYEKEKKWEGKKS